MKNNKTVMPKQAAPVERNNPSATAAGAGAAGAVGASGAAYYFGAPFAGAGSDAE